MKAQQRLSLSQGLLASSLCLGSCKGRTCIRGLWKPLRRSSPGGRWGGSQSWSKDTDPRTPYDSCPIPGPGTGVLAPWWDAQGQGSPSRGSGRHSEQGPSPPGTAVGAPVGTAAGLAACPACRRECGRGLPRRGGKEEKAVAWRQCFQAGGTHPLGMSEPKRNEISESRSDFYHSFLSLCPQVFPPDWNILEGEHCSCCYCSHSHHEHYSQVTQKGNVRVGTRHRDWPQHSVLLPRSLRCALIKPASPRT